MNTHTSGEKIKHLETILQKDLGKLSDEELKKLWETDVKFKKHKFE